MGSAESKPNSIQQFNIYSTYLLYMKIQLKCTCYAIHDDLKSFKQKPVPKIAQKTPKF